MLQGERDGRHAVPEQAQSLLSVPIPHQLPESAPVQMEGNLLMALEKGRAELSDQCCLHLHAHNEGNGMSEHR